jgi:hypothetical protein
MRLIFTLSFACLLILPSLTNAQQKAPQGRWTATFTPALIPLPTGGQFGIQPGIEYAINSRLAILTEVTFQTGKNQHNDSIALDKEYLRIKPELRYYLVGRENRISSYVSLQASYTFRSFSNKNAGYYYDNFTHDSVFAFDEAAISSPITTFSFQYGLVLSDGKRMAADLFAGMGLRFINTTFNNVVNLRRERTNGTSDAYTAAASYQKKGKVSEMYFNAGVRFMFRFGPMR